MTTSYDLGLERAFADAGEELDVVAYDASEGPGRARFWHRPHGGEPIRIDVPNTYAAELDLDAHAPSCSVSREWSTRTSPAAGRASS